MRNVVNNVNNIHNDPEIREARLKMGAAVREVLNGSMNNNTNETNVTDTDTDVDVLSRYRECCFEDQKVFYDAYHNLKKVCEKKGINFNEIDKHSLYKEVLREYENSPDKSSIKLKRLNEWHILGSFVAVEAIPLATCLCAGLFVRSTGVQDGMVYGSLGAGLLNPLAFGWYICRQIKTIKNFDVYGTNGSSGHTQDMTFLTINSINNNNNINNNNINNNNINNNNINNNDNNNINNNDNNNINNNDNNNGSNSEINNVTVSADQSLGVNIPVSNYDISNSNIGLLNNNNITNVLNQRIKNSNEINNSIRISHTERKDATKNLSVDVLGNKTERNNLNIIGFNVLSADKGRKDDKKKKIHVKK